MNAALAMGADALFAFLDREFPQSEPHRYSIEAVEPGRVRLRRVVDDRDLRPGGTVSGPTLMALCDMGIYLAILAVKGPVALAVTTSLTINFLRKPGVGDLVAETRLLKLGKRLAVGEVHVFSDGLPEPVAQATATYSIP